CALDGYPYYFDYW
nr:immunoglobulin heavy chain junction region [Mus musculus]